MPEAEESIKNDDSLLCSTNRFVFPIESRDILPELDMDMVRMVEEASQLGSARGKSIKKRNETDR